MYEQSAEAAAAMSFRAELRWGLLLLAVAIVCAHTLWTLTRGHNVERSAEMSAADQSPAGSTE